MSADMKLAEDPRFTEWRIAKLELKPGDVLVLKLSLINYGQEAMSKLAKYLAPIVGDANKVLVLKADDDIAVLTREQIDARAL